MTLAADAKKVAAQFSKAAKVQQLTAQLRDTYGTSINRKELKAYEKQHKLVVQWVARREAPAQTFRTPLGFERISRGTFRIPAATAREEGLVNEAGVPVTVTEVPGGPGRDVREVNELTAALPHGS